MLHCGMLEGELRRSRPKVQRTSRKAGCQCFARLRANPRIPLGISVRLPSLASLEKQCRSNIPRLRLQSFSSGRCAGRITRRTEFDQQHQSHELQRHVESCSPDALCCCDFAAPCQNMAILYIFADVNWDQQK